MGEATDVIRVIGLRARGAHGVAAAERRSRQTFVIDLELRLDTGLAGREDALSATVDYVAAAQVAAGVVAGPSRRLLETLAAEIAARLLAGFASLEEVGVRVHKPGADLGWPFDDVSVEVRRRR